MTAASPTVMSRWIGGVNICLGVYNDPDMSYYIRPRATYTGSGSSGPGAYVWGCIGSLAFIFLLIFGIQGTNGVYASIIIIIIISSSIIIIIIIVIVIVIIITVFTSGSLTP